jgi:uncharacterized spore protein YtfJ
MNLREMFTLILVLTLFTVCPAFADGETASTNAFLNGFSDLLEKNFSSSQTFGNPINAGDYVVIPVVCKITGFGFGNKLEGKELVNTGNQQAKSNSQKGRIGLGGGVVLKPIALIFIKNDGEFNVVNLNEGFFSQLGKSMGPAMVKMVKETVKSLLKYKLSKLKKKRPVLRPVKRHKVMKKPKR